VGVEAVTPEEEEALDEAIDDLFDGAWLDEEWA
jgi:hypothetical protein